MQRVAYTFSNIGTVEALGQGIAKAGSQSHCGWNTEDFHGLSLEVPQKEHFDVLGRAHTRLSLFLITK